MKLLKLTVLNRTETHIIGELEYSVFSLFPRQKTIKRKVFKEIESYLWSFLDTGETVYEYECLNAILSTNKETYEI